VLETCLLCMLLYTSKSKVIFDDKGNLKNFGNGNGYTLFSYGVFVVLFAILSVFLFAFIELFCD